MNNVVNKFLLAGDKFMPEMHLRQPQFVYSACGPSTRHKERIKKFKQTGDARYIYRNELDKACFQHDAACTKYKDAENRLISDQKLKNSAYDIASNPKYDGYQRNLASMVYKFFSSKVAPLDKKTMSGKGNAKHTAKPSSLERTENNKILAEELHKPVIKKIATSKNVYYNVLDDVVSKYNNTKHSTINMKPTDVKDNKRVYIDEHNEKDSRCKVGDRVRISKFKNIFAKGYTPNWSKEIFIVDKINDTVRYTYNIEDLNDEEIIGSFYDKELQKSIL